MTLKEFMEKPDSAILAEAAQCGSMEELKGFFAGQGVTITAGEAEKLYALLSKTKVTELSDEDLDKIAGGGWYYWIEDCPRGHTKRVRYFEDSAKGIVDENCLQCQYVIYTYVQGHGNIPHCPKQSKDKTWEGEWYDW